MAEVWPVHTLVFDLDDTIYPESDFVLSGFCAVDEWLQKCRGVTGFEARARMLFEGGLRGRIFDEALTALGIPADKALVEEMVKLYREHLPSISLPAEARELLDWAAVRFNLAIITDGHAAVQRRKLAALGLDRWVDCAVVTDELGRDFWKPHPAGFERVMARFPGPSPGFVYLADNPRKDFLAPKKLGWRTVRVRRNDGEHSKCEATPAESPEVTIPELRQLPRLLQSMSPAS